ncbi:MAG TPA: molybdopterin cofactor-binding domain-containing protein [Acidimicrobiia bacterium]|nr:molybdopterin cofactor-binding domain-containing protein [Acidimicrobiia bacterium]
MKRSVVGRSEWRVDGRALVTGAPVFTADMAPVDTLHLVLVTSPRPHARIAAIDTAAAEATEGVVCVLTHENTPATRYTTAGQGHPEPSPYDTRMFDSKVRFVGDRVAAVAAETAAVARGAAALISVEYEDLPPVLSIDQAVAAGAPVIHDEDDALDIFDARSNVAAAVAARVGDPDSAFATAETVVETLVETQYAQHAPLEPHVAFSYLDPDGRIVIVSSTQVPFHARRIVARLLDIPIHRLRVIKPRLGGGFGAKQEVIVEDLVAMVTQRTRRPALIELTREQEFVSSRTRHPMRIEMRLGADADGVVDAIAMDVISNTGAYGAHALTVLSNAGSKTLPLYNHASAISFDGRAVYTNLPVAGAYRGYGASQGSFALETAMDMLADELGLDPVELRSRNHIRAGETSPIFEELGEGRKGVPYPITSCALDDCLRIGAEQFGWAEKRSRPRDAGPLRRGVGMAAHMQGSGIPLVDMGAATIVMNDDGSFHLFVGATDLGTGSDTILAQIAAEVLGVPLDAVVVTASDTDLTPFDAGAYASSTTYVSGRAVEEAAEAVRRKIIDVAAGVLEVDAGGLDLADRKVATRDGSASIELAAIGRRSYYGPDPGQIAATASFVPEGSPPPFTASFVEVEVDIETGFVNLLDYVCAVDCGVAINPALAEGQVEGAIANGIGYALTEEMEFTDTGRTRNPDLARYQIPGALDLPPIRVFLVDSNDPTGPMGAKSVAEIGINGPLPAIANAIHHAVGIRMTKPPFTPERMWRALREAEVAAGAIS